MLCSSRNLSNTNPLQEALKNISSGTDLPTPSTQVVRDAQGGFAVVKLAASSIESSGATLDIASTSNTQTVILDQELEYKQSMLETQEPDKQQLTSVVLEIL